MNLLEELKQRTSDAKTMVEIETRNLKYLEEHYQIILTKIRECSDLGNNSYIVQLPKRYQCTHYIIKKLTEENLTISDINSFARESSYFGTIEKEIYNQFKVSW